MSTSKLILPALILIIALVIIAQQKPIYEMLGQNVKTVINTYGKPAKHDKSDPLLEMIFYKTADLQMCFVATDNNVFQTEMTKGFSNKSGAAKLFNEYATDIMSSGLTQADSSDLKRSFHSDNKMIDLEVFHNVVKKQYELRVKAQKF